MITAATFVVALFAPGMVVKTGTLILTYLESPHLIPMDQEHLIQIFWINGSRIITILGLPIALLSANLVQHKLIFSGQQMIPKISKLNPITGLKRMFSPRGLLEFTKSLFKIIIVAVVVLMLVLPERDKLTQLMAVDLQFILPFVRGLALRMLVAVAIIMMFISLIDFLYQKFDHRKNLRMSKQDIKDENKQADGDPAIKARIRSLRMERGRRPRTRPTTPSRCSMMRRSWTHPNWSPRASISSRPASENWRRSTVSRLSRIHRSRERSTRASKSIAKFRSSTTGRSPISSDMS